MTVIMQIGLFKNNYTDEQFNNSNDNNINNNTLVELEEKNNEHVSVDCSKHNISKIVEKFNENKNDKEYGRNIYF